MYFDNLIFAKKVFDFAGNQLHQILSGPIMTATLALPPLVASSLLQQHITAAFQSQAQAGNVGKLVVL
jgi:hypothetical protein